MVKTPDPKSIEEPVATANDAGTDKVAAPKPKAPRKPRAPKKKEAPATAAPDTAISEVPANTAAATTTTIVKTEEEAPVQIDASGPGESETRILPADPVPREEESLPPAATTTQEKDEEEKIAEPIAKESHGIRKDMEYRGKVIYWQRLQNAQQRLMEAAKKVGASRWYNRFKK